MPFVRREVIGALVAAAALVACATGPAPTSGRPEDDRAFMGWLTNLEAQLAADPTAKAMAVQRGPQTDEYRRRLHDAYRHKTTRDQLTEWLVARYPGNRYEVNYIVERLPR